MSRAVELAAKVGSRTKIYERHPAIDWHEMTTEQLEAFYHAARAEMAMEAADFCEIEGQLYAGYDCAQALRAMADREGK